MPIERLRSLQPVRIAELDAAITVIKAGRGTGGKLGYLPILARRSDWSAIIDLKDGSSSATCPSKGSSA